MYNVIVCDSYGCDVVYTTDDYNEADELREEYDSNLIDVDVVYTEEKQYA